MTNDILLRSRMTGNCHVRFRSRVRRGDLPGLDNIDEKDAEAVIKCCRENNIKEFTISNNSTGMIRAIMAL